LALTFQTPSRAKSQDEAIILARPGLAYLGLAWPGSRPEAGPSTSLASGNREFPFFTFVSFFVLFSSFFLSLDNSKGSQKKPEQSF